MKWLGWAAVWIIAGCAPYPVSESVRKEARKDLTFDVVAADPAAYKGALVIWGGEVIGAETTKTGTRLHVLETPLASHERPTSPRHGEGRFIAETAKFLDTTVYRPGVRVTVAGTVEGARTEAMQGGQYRYPVLEVAQIAAWELRLHGELAPDWTWGPGLAWAWDDWYEPDFWDWDWERYQTMPESYYAWDIRERD